MQLNATYVKGTKYKHYVKHSKFQAHVALQ